MIKSGHLVKRAKEALSRIERGGKTDYLTLNYPLSMNICAKCGIGYSDTLRTHGSFCGDMSKYKYPDYQCDGVVIDRAKMSKGVDIER